MICEIEIMFWVKACGLLAVQGNMHTYEEARALHLTKATYPSFRKLKLSELR
jgi:hypothetical protein